MSIHLKEVNQDVIHQVSSISATMFHKGFFGISYGSISAKVSQDRFIINKDEAIFDTLNTNNLILLDTNRDYRWNDASKDAYIHADIYAHFSEAKFIIYAMPPYIMAFSLRNLILEPKDYFGYESLGQKVEIFDPKDFETWYERADTDVVRYFKQNQQDFIIVRGYGVYVFGRDLGVIAKKIDIIEQSAKILSLSQSLELNLQDHTHYGI